MHATQLISTCRHMLGVQLLQCALQSLWQQQRKDNALPKNHLGSKLKPGSRMLAVVHC